MADVDVGGTSTLLDSFDGRIDVSRGRHDGVLRRGAERGVQLRRSRRRTSSEAPDVNVEAAPITPAARLPSHGPPASG